MGKVETTRKKRPREFHCFKAGLKILLSKKRAMTHKRREDRVDDDKKVDCGSASVLVNSPGSSSTIEIDIAETCLESPKQEKNVVPVYRPAEVESQRENLPIVMMEQEIMEKIKHYNSVIICGETGCGKTTQVPQFLYEAAYGSKHSRSRSGLIGVTQPRRVAVLATAKRVAYELGLHLGKEVGFQVRHDKMIGDDCSIKFMTDGILLREIQNDFLLKRYSIIILDEAHERSLNTDILIGMLSRVIQERQRLSLEQKEIEESIDPENRIYPLKLVLMSATLRVEDFVSNRRIFHDPPPVIDVPTRQYPVTVHFAKITDEDNYVGQAYKKVLLIHKRLPPGGILVFLTGQREVKYLCQKLRKASIAMMIEYNNQLNSASGSGDSQGGSSTDCFGSDDDLSGDESDSNEGSDLDEDLSNQEHMESTVLQNKDAFEAMAGKRSFEHGSQGKEVSNVGGGAGPMRVLPLYAMLPASEQLSVFEQVKEGERLVVVATNVAETSLTIPGIKYVVDSGKEKVKKYNSSNGTEEYGIEWISKASAAQRAGRSGRTGPGHCYRLYSSAVFTNLFPQFSTAEILEVPVDGVVLLMKSMHIDKVAKFPFPTPPEATAIAEAERCLKVLGALDSQGRLTTLGEAMARYPMSPRHSRMLLTVILVVPRNVQRRNKSAIRPNLVLAHAVAAAAAMTLPNPFTDGKDAVGTEEAGGNLRKEKPKKEIKFCNPDSDALTTAFTLQCFELSTLPAVDFCSDNGLHLKTMQEMSKLRRQLLQLIFSSENNLSEFVWTHGGKDDVEHAWRVPSHPLSENEEKIIRKAICAGWADRVAKRFTTKGATNSGGLLSVDGDRKVDAVRYQACSVVNEAVFLDRCSSLSRCAPKFLVYSELLRTKKRVYIRGATKVEAAWIVEYAPSMCTFSSPHPVYDSETDQVCSQAIPIFGPHLWQLAGVRHNLPMEDGWKRVGVFAAALLEGRVLPCMSSKSCFLRPGGVKRAGKLLEKLLSKGIDSRSRLKKLWEEDDWRELFLEIRDCYERGFHDGFEELWVEMQHEILSLAPRIPWHN